MSGWISLTICVCLVVRSSPLGTVTSAGILGIVSLGPRLPSGSIAWTSTAIPSRTSSISFCPTAPQTRSSRPESNTTTQNA